MPDPAPEPDADRPADTSAARAARRHPAERRMSRATGTMLLVMIVQAAFGYALVGLATASWVRDVHFGGGVVVLALAGYSSAAARMLPVEGRRTTALRLLTRVLVALVGVELALGLMIKGWVPTDAGGLATWHIGLGLLVTLVVVVVHVLSIGPSILLGAAREHERSRAARDAKRSR